MKRLLWSDHGRKRSSYAFSGITIGYVFIKVNLNFRLIPAIFLTLMIPLQVRGINPNKFCW